MCAARGGPLYLRSLPPGLDDVASLRRLAEDRRFRLLAGLYEGACVGAALVSVDAALAPVAAVKLLYVEPPAREVGVGRRLVDEAARVAAEAGCTGLDVPALPGDRLTKSLLEAAGHRARLVVMHRPLVAPER